MTNMQEVFWEVALTNDRDAFIRGKRHEYTKTTRAVRLDRSHKSTIFATTASNARNARLDRLAGRA